MSDLLSYTVHVTNYFQIFELNSTEKVRYPGYKSIESFIGRKCFEFEWIGGDKGFAIGIYSVSSYSETFFWGGLEEGEQFKSRDTKGNQTNDKIQYLPINFTNNIRYMVCFDMLINKLILIYQNQTFSYDHEFEPNSKWKILFHQANYNGKDLVKGYFHYPFENPLPVAFYSLIDKRSYDYKSLKSNDFKVSLSLFFVDILYKS